LGRHFHFMEAWICYAKVAGDTAVIFGSIKKTILKPALPPFFVYFSVPLAEPQAMQGDILRTAGKPGDRWAGLRKEAGREESPDTVVFASHAWDGSSGRNCRD
jgi:hypothetical protein